MTLLKSSEIGRNYGLTRHAVHDSIKRGLIPESIISRVGGSVLIDADALRNLVREGKVFRRSRPKAMMDVRAEDSFTVSGKDYQAEHRWTDDLTGRVGNHPYEDGREKRAVSRQEIALLTASAAVALEVSCLKS